MKHAKTERDYEGYTPEPPASVISTNVNEPLPLRAYEEPLPPVTKEGFLGHLRTINRHKALVTKYCFKAGIYRQGLAHDLSKYAPVELLIGARYFQGTRSPNAAEREDRGFTEAWLHHKGRNRHHSEYWLEVTSHFGTFAAPMPVRYVVEMMCDRVAACRVYQGERYTDSSALEYFERFYDANLMHPDSKALLHRLLKMVAELGEEEAFARVRRDIVKPKWHAGEHSRW